MQLNLQTYLCYSLTCGVVPYEPAQVRNTLQHLLLMQGNPSYMTSESSVVVHTSLGIIEGFESSTPRGDVGVFLGIPYAQPPVGELRFKRPVPIQPWKGCLKCKKYKKRAPQIDHFWDRLMLKVGKSEDCLYLNIVAPRWKCPEEQGNGFAVMVYIHGGGYLVDSAVFYHYSKLKRTFF
ncbi:hypothetical protein AB6A40_006061 [Gnathostoma spinigerum]|uniref:Carboxylesterase type B domain-containing protein n=1 Tax=Gnathostoma spinigerum TaxID=75299 RepID=A0ABD6ERN7_9BILA